MEPILTGAENAEVQQMEREFELTMGDKDMVLYNRYKQTYDPRDLANLVNALMPLAMKMANKYKRGTISNAGFNLLIMKHLGTAINKYDPSRGAKISTYAANYMLKLLRDMGKASNMVYMGEDETTAYPRVQMAIGQLQSVLGRDPTHHEIAHRYNENQGFIASKRKNEFKAMTHNDVQRLLSRDFRDHFESNNALTTVNNQFDNSDRILKYIRDNLTDNERLVFDAKNRGESVEEIVTKLPDLPGDTAEQKRNAYNYRYNKPLWDKVTRLRTEIGEI